MTNYDPTKFSPNAESNFIRLLLYGKAKTRKTWWAGTAAATHNVTILDGERGSGIFSQLSQDEQARCQVIDLGGGQIQPVMATFCAELFKNGSLIWDMDKHCSVPDRTVYREDGNYLDINLSRCTEADIIIIDSWTKIVTDLSIIYMQDNGLDEFGGVQGRVTEKGGNDGMDFYRVQGIRSEAILSSINGLPVHVILIGHEQSYEHKVKKGAITTKESRLQVVSVSGKQSAKLPGVMSDLLWFKSAAFGDDVEIHTEAESYRDGGGRTIPPMTHNFSKWKFKDYLKEAKRNPDPRPLPIGNPDTNPRPFQYRTGAWLNDQVSKQVTTTPEVTAPSGIMKFKLGK